MDTNAIDITMPSVRYRRGDAVRVRVTNLKSGRMVADYTESIARVDGPTCTTSDGNIWDALTGASIGWLIADQYAVIMLESCATTPPNARRLAR